MHVVVMASVMETESDRLAVEVSVHREGMVKEQVHLDGMTNLGIPGEFAKWMRPMAITSENHNQG